MRRALVPEAEIVPIQDQLPKPAIQIIPKRYPKKFMQCRSLDHEWSHTPGLVDHPRYYTVKGLLSECLTCGLVRYRWLLANGRRHGMKYEYPHGYQVSPKDNPELIRIPKKHEWRAQYVRTLGFREEQHDEIEARRKGKQ
jgi:hypothetical protein